MDYETICAGNRKLFADLEACTYKLKELTDQSEIDVLINHKQYLNKLIDHNLECLDIVWRHASDYRAAKRFRDRPASKEVMQYYRTNPDSPLPVIAGVCGVSLHTVSRIITDNLYH